MFLQVSLSVWASVDLSEDLVVIQASRNFLYIGPTLHRHLLKMYEERFAFRVLCVQSGDMMVWVYR